jgi:hypothetical protein
VGISVLSCGLVNGIPISVNFSICIMDGGSRIIHPPASIAKSVYQKRSLAELSLMRKYRHYEDISVDDRTNYFNISCRPITKKAEDDMELVSDIITWGEMYLHHWEKGTYRCARCSIALYSSEDKWVGPCVWPSFRKPIDDDAISATEVFPYNRYTVTVKEVYCSKCDLFLGHQFEDGALKGDRHPNARWRH